MESNRTSFIAAGKETVPDLLLLFDGICNLCDRSVQFVIRHDRAGKFKFAALQSGYTRSLLDSPLGDRLAPLLNAKATNTQPAQLRSLILIADGQVFIRSTAVIKVLQILGFPWSLSAALLILPEKLRDGLYNYIARHRYHWFGKKDQCMVPTPALKSRFMDGVEADVN